MISTPTVSPLIICFSRVALAIVLVLLQLPVQAQNYPTRPIRLISPFPAGGANDVLARVLAGKLAERLRGSVVVENRPGAGAVIGLTVLARSAPDGYTLALSGSTLAVAGTLYKQPAFDAMKDFAVPATAVRSTTCCSPRSCLARAKVSSETACLIVSSVMKSYTIASSGGIFAGRRFFFRSATISGDNPALSASGSWANHSTWERH
jgi:Tripartite tricarboxylate transporter family receptor